MRESPLLPETKAALRGQREGPTVFANIIAAEMFEAAHSIGDLKILPFLGRGGGFVVFNTKAPNNEGVLGWYAKVEQADDAMRAEWAERKKAA